MPTKWMRLTLCRMVGLVGIGGAGAPSGAVAPRRQRVDDVDARVAKAVKAGAKVMKPAFDVPGVGGVRIENDVLVTETGHEVLSALPATVRVR